MTRSELSLLVGGLLAVVVPGAVLAVFPGDDRAAAGLTAAPFAWPRVLAAHLVTALPLGVVLALRLRPDPAGGYGRGTWAVVGLGAAAVAAIAGPAVGDLLDGVGAGPIPLLLLRTAVATALVLPWCLAGVTGWSDDSPRPGRWAITVALLVALVPAGVYAGSVVRSKTTAAEEARATGRLVKADRLLAGVCELGGDRPVGKQTPAEARRAIRKEFDGLAKAADRPLPANAPPAARFDRAVVLIQLDRLDEAADLLRPLAANTQPLLLLASVYRDQEKWAEAGAAYTEALGRLTPADRDGYRLALDGLAFVARADHRPADAEAALKRGLAELPADAAHYHLQLGRHYSDGGRPGPALDHLRAAADLDPKGAGAEADGLIRHLRTTTYGCFSAGR